MSSHIRCAQRITARSDKAARLIRSRTQNWRDFRRCTFHHQLDIAVFRAITANSGLDHLFRRTGHTDGTHITSRMSADIAHGIDNFGTENGRRQPPVECRGLTVLPDDQTFQRLAQFFLQQIDSLDVINALHFPRCGRSRCTNGRSRSNPVIVIKFINRNQFRLADTHRRVTQHAAMICPATTASRVNGAALDRGFDVFLNEYASHSASPACSF